MVSTATIRSPIRGRVVRTLSVAASLLTLQSCVDSAPSDTAVPRTPIFKLRANALFHDGSAVDSTAVKASLERSLANADIDSFPGLADIVAVEASSPLELILRLRERSTFLLDDLGVAIQKTHSGGLSIGTGPYVTSSTSQNELVMTAFSRHYRGTPKIDQIVWKAYPAVRAAWAAMMRGEVDVLYEVGPEAL